MFLTTTNGGNVEISRTFAGLGFVTMEHAFIDLNKIQNVHNRNEDSCKTNQATMGTAME